LNPLAYFDIQVINLPSRADRREEFAREPSAVGMSYADVRIFPAARPDDANGFPSVARSAAFSAISAHCAPPNPGDLH
jgi:hypothetical protein